MATKEVRNADNGWLYEPRGLELNFGDVDEVNGVGAEEIEGFKPTRHELLQLALYWAERAAQIEFDRFVDLAGTDSRALPFARARVDRIEDLLGDEVEEVIKRASKMVEARSDPRHWGIWQNGTTAQLCALQEEVKKTKAVEEYLRERAERRSKNRRTRSQERKSHTDAQNHEAATTRG